MIKATRNNEDLLGFIRGEHLEGPHVCEMYRFKMPGQTQGLWGWNDTSALYCDDCGRLASDHCVLAQPKLEQHATTNNKPRHAEPLPHSTLDAQQLDELRKTRQAAKAAAQSDLEMLDDASDPLAIAANAGRKPPPRATAAAGDRVQAAAQLVTERACNDAFKEEVEQMIRDSLAKERQEGDLLAPKLAKPRYVTSAELLAAAGLEQYLAAFEAEAMDPATLYEVMEQQGRVALEEVLVELGVSSKGHRMKICNLASP